MRRRAGSAMVLTFFVFSSAFVIWSDLQLAATTSAAIKFQQQQQQQIDLDKSDLLLMSDDSLEVTAAAAASNDIVAHNILERQVKNNASAAAAKLPGLKYHLGHLQNQNVSAIKLPSDGVHKNNSNLDTNVDINNKNKNNSNNNSNNSNNSSNSREPRMMTDGDEGGEEEEGGELVDLLMAGSEMRIITARPPGGIFTLKVVNTTMEVEEGWKSEKNNSVRIGEVEDISTNGDGDDDLASAAAFNGRFFRSFPDGRFRGPRPPGRGRRKNLNLDAPGFNNLVRTPGLHSLGQEERENENNRRYFDSGPRYNPSVGDAPSYLTDDYYNSFEGPKVYDDYEYPPPAAVIQPEHPEQQIVHHQLQHHLQNVIENPSPPVRNVRRRRPQPQPAHTAAAVVNPKPFTPHRPAPRRRRRRKRPHQHTPPQPAPVNPQPNPAENMNLDDLPQNGRGFKTKVYNKVVTTTITDTPGNEEKRVVEQIKEPILTEDQLPPDTHVDYSAHGGPVGNGYGREAVINDETLPPASARLYDRSPWKPFRPQGQRPGYGRAIDQPQQPEQQQQQYQTGNNNRNGNGAPGPNYYHHQQSYGVPQPNLPNQATYDARVRSHGNANYNNNQSPSYQYPGTFVENPHRRKSFEIPSFEDLENPDETSSSPEERGENSRPSYQFDRDTKIDEDGFFNDEFVLEFSDEFPGGQKKVGSDHEGDSFVKSRYEETPAGAGDYAHSDDEGYDYPEYEADPPSADYPHQQQHSPQQGGGPPRRRRPPSRPSSHSQPQQRPQGYLNSHSPSVPPSPPQQQQGYYDNSGNTRYTGHGAKAPTPTPTTQRPRYNPYEVRNQYAQHRHTRRRPHTPQGGGPRPSRGYGYKNRAEPPQGITGHDEREEQEQQQQQGYRSPASYSPKTPAFDYATHRVKPPRHYRPPAPYKSRKEHNQQQRPRYQATRGPELDDTTTRYQRQRYRTPPTRQQQQRHQHRKPPQQQQEYPEDEEEDYPEEEYDEDQRPLRRPFAGDGAERNDGKHDQDYQEEYEREADEDRGGTEAGSDYDYEEEQLHPEQQATPKAHKHERPDVYVKGKVYGQDDYYNGEEDEKAKYKYNPDDFAMDDGQWDDVFNGHRNIIDDDIKDLSKNHEDYTAPEGHEQQQGGQEQQQEEREAEKDGGEGDEDRDYRQHDLDYRNQERDNSHQDRDRKEQDSDYREQDYHGPDEDYQERDDYNNRDRDYRDSSSSKRPEDKEQADYEDIDDREAERDPRGDGYDSSPDYRYREDYEGDYPTQNKNSHDKPGRGKRRHRHEGTGEEDYRPEAMTAEDDRELSRNINENEKAAEGLRYQDEQDEDDEESERDEGGEDYEYERRPSARIRGGGRDNSRSGFYPGSGSRPGNSDIPGFDSFFNRVESKIEEEINGAPSWAVPKHDMEKKDKPADGVIDNTNDVKPNAHNQDIEPHSFDFQMPSHEELAENYQTVSASDLSLKWSPVKMIPSPKAEEKKKNA